MKRHRITMLKSVNNIESHGLQESMDVKQNMQTEL